MRFRIAGEGLGSPSVYDSQDPDRLTGDDSMCRIEDIRLTIPIEEALKRSLVLTKKLLGLTVEK